MGGENEEGGSILTLFVMTVVGSLRELAAIMVVGFVVAGRPVRQSQHVCRETRASRIPSFVRRIWRSLDASLGSAAFLLFGSSFEWRTPDGLPGSRRRFPLARLASACRAPAALQSASALGLAAREQMSKADEPDGPERLVTCGW